MITRDEYAKYALVYTYTGSVTHLIPGIVLWGAEPPALCKRIPNYPWNWLGYGNQEEKDRAVNQPLCKRCEKLSADGE